MFLEGCLWPSKCSIETSFHTGSCWLLWAIASLLFCRDLSHEPGTGNLTLAWPP